MQGNAIAPGLERQSTHALLTTGISVVLGLALSVIVSRTLGPTGKGLLDVASATAGLFTLVLGASLNVGLTHFVARNGNVPAGIAVRLALWGAGAAGVTALCLMPRPDISLRLGLLPACDTLFWIGFVVVSVGFGVWAAGLRGVLIGRHLLITTNRIDIAIKAMLVAAYAAFALGLSFDPRMFAITGAGAGVVLSVAFLVALHGPTVPATNFWPALIATTLHVHITNVLHFLNQRADVFFVQAFRGATEVGLYALAVSLAQIVLLISSALAQPLLPQVSGTLLPAESAAATARTCRVFVVLGLLSAALLAFCAAWLVPLVFGRDFSGSLPSMLMLLPGMIAFGITNILISYFVGIGRSATNLWISIATLLVTIIGNLWLTRHYGARGAAGTSTIAYGLAGALSLFFFVRQARTSALEVVCPTVSDWHAAISIVGRFRL